MPKGKKREATPKAPQVSPASVDAPPAPLDLPIGWGGKTVSPTKFDPSKTAKEAPAQPEPPEELAAVWDDGIAATFKALLPRQQDFLLNYIRCWNAAESYRQSHNPLATDHVASANGSRLVANDSISLILAKFANQKTESLFLVQKTYNEAATLATKPIFGKDDLGQPILVMEQPDYAVRIKAAEALSKLHGLNAAEKVDHTIQAKVVHVVAPPKKPEGHGSAQPG